jgi:hypothetical protein
VLPENEPMLALLGRLGGDLAITRGAGHLDVEVRLDPSRIARLARG